MNKLALCCTTIVVALCMPVFVSAYVSPGASSGYVNDFAHIISDATEQQINQELQQFEASTTIEVAVVTIPSLGGDDIAPFANTLFREWGIGKKETNNGVLLLIAPHERKLRIEVGYGLEGILTDLQSGFIIDTIITPEFKADNYDGGIVNGVAAILQVVKGEQFDVQSSSGGGEIPGWVIEFGFVAVIAVLQLIGSFLAVTKEWWHGGVLGGLIGLIGLYFFGISVGIISVSVLALLGLIIDYYLSSSYKRWKNGSRSRPWYMSTGGGSRSSRGGFGGFGGGSSGGGGASGSW